MWKPIGTIPKDGKAYGVIRWENEENSNCDLVFFSNEPSREFGGAWWSTITNSEIYEPKLFSEYTHWTELPE